MSPGRTAEVTLVPFRALRYDAARVGDPGAVWAPPYDVISTEQAEALRERHPRNIVRITLPRHDRPDRYGAAAERLRSWIEEGTLVRDPDPCGYVHRQWFTDVLGRERVRTGLWALIRLVDLDAGAVLPHERTMSGPKEDRLSLMRATRAQLSPVFFVASDPDSGFLRALESGAEDGPVERTEFPAGERHEISRLGGERVEELAGRLRGETLLIADGHHRYETALAYRDERAAAADAAAGGDGPEHVLAYIVSERDPGLAVFPTHRVYTTEAKPSWAAALERPAEGFRVERIDERRLADDPAALVSEIEGGPAFIIVVRGLEDGWRVELTTDGVEGAGLDAAAARLSSVAFHEGFVRLAARGDEPEDAGDRVSYTRDPAEAVRRVRHGPAAAAVLLSGARIEQIREATRGGVRLPPKTTFFAPKVPTGPAIHLMDAP